MRYVPEYDGLRAIAALSVVAFHSVMPGGAGGFLGVDVFFVLSGYLTASLALSMKAQACGAPWVAEFLSRRFWRLWPLLAVATMFGAGVAIWMGRSPWPEAIPSIAYLSNVSIQLIEYPKLLSHTWTLALEMQFYIVLVLLVRLVPSRRALAVILAVAFALCTLERMSLADQYDLKLGHFYNWKLGYFGGPAHATGLLLGSLAALSPGSPMPHSRTVAALCLLAIGVMMANARFGTTETMTHWILLTELASIVLVLALRAAHEAGTRAPFLAWKPLRYVGLWSYGIYLWHFPLTHFVAERYPGWTSFLVCLPVLVGISALTHRYVEAPFRARGRKVAHNVAVA